MSLDLFFNATIETLYMVFCSALGASTFGIPMGVLLFAFSKGQILQAPKSFFVLNALVNTVRSVPFIILLVAIIPFTRFLVGSSIGSSSAIVPLTIAASPFAARLVESALRELPKGLIDAMQSMGATPRQILFGALFPEALPSITRGLILMLVNLIGYSAMAGTVGGGGLGDLAIRYGYQRFDAKTMLITVLILVVLVQSVQAVGDLIVKRLEKCG